MCALRSAGGSPLKLCVNCDTDLGCGNCGACFDFRLASLEATRLAGAKACRHCEYAPAIARGLCRACYQYRYRTGKDRPISRVQAEALEIRRNVRAFERKELARLARLREAHDAGF